VKVEVFVIHLSELAVFDQLIYFSGHIAENDGEEMIERGDCYLMFCNFLGHFGMGSLHTFVDFRLEGQCIIHSESDLFVCFCGLPARDAEMLESCTELG
jgi:hypothetical protein